MLNTPFSPWPSFTAEEADAVRDVVLDVALKALGIGPGDEVVVTPRTKAVICVHLAGSPCDMDPIMALAESTGGEGGMVTTNDEALWRANLAR